MCRVKNCNNYFRFFLLAPNLFSNFLLTNRAIGAIVVLLAGIRQNGLPIPFKNRNFKMPRSSNI